MNNDVIEKMADRLASEILETDDVPHSVSPIRTAAVGPDEDVALANVDQAFDNILAAMKVLDDNLSKVKVSGVPERAGIDAIQDLMDTAIKPYLADALRVMQVFGK